MIEIDWKEMPNLSKLTLVVPTYNRQRYALRQMHFWSGSPVTIHVLDGTSMPIDAKDLKCLESNVHYYHMPCSIEGRFGKAVKLVDTQYVSFLCDDEFLIPSVLDHCIEELKIHKDFVVCAGNGIAFHSSKKGIYGKQLSTDLKNYKIDGTTARERMVAHMNPHEHSTYYAVQLSEVWKKSTEIIAKHSFSTPYIQEIQLELATCYQGKAMVIEELMRLRNEENKPTDLDNWNRKIPISEWMQNPCNAEEVKIFYENTAMGLAKIDGADDETVMGDLKLAVDAHLDWMEKRRLLASTATLRDKIMQLIPKKLRMMIHMARIYFTWKPIITQAEILQKEGATVNMKQLREIVKYMEAKQ